MTDKKTDELEERHMQTDLAASPICVTASILCRHEKLMLQIIDDDDEQEPDKRPEFHSSELLLDYFIHEISCRNNFEFIQAVIRLFLKVHGETIRQQPKLQDKARKLLEIQCAVWHRVDKLFQSARCIITFLSNSQF